jgi:hypothetical protein
LEGGEAEEIVEYIVAEVVEKWECKEERGVLNEDKNISMCGFI